MDARRNIQDELRNWERNVSQPHPAVGEYFRVLCTYAEIYKRPFKLTAERIGTYSKAKTADVQLVTYVPKKEYRADLERFVNEALSDRYVYQEIDAKKSFWRTVGNFFEGLVGQHDMSKLKENVWKDIPGLYQQQVENVLLNFPHYLEIAKNNTTSKYKVQVPKYVVKNVGTLTGRYYFDFFGYLWLEVEPLFFDAARAWVRETAVDYDSKKEMQDWINAQRPDMNTSTPSSTPRNVSLLSLALLVLSSR